MPPQWSVKMGLTSLKGIVAAAVVLVSSSLPQAKINKMGSAMRAATEKTFCMGFISR